VPIVIREATAADSHGITRVLVDGCQTTYVRILPADFLPSFTYDQHEAGTRGLVDIQRRGIGRRLVECVVQWLDDGESRSMRVWVLHDNPYPQFYDALGGEDIHDFGVPRNGFDRCAR
jgi:GNAT superfamily N-acetyltransferase